MIGLELFIFGGYGRKYKDKKLVLGSSEHSDHDFIWEIGSIEFEC